MRKRLFIGGLAAAAVALAVVGLAGGATKGASPLPASSCGPLQYGGPGGSPQFIVASDLPLQGSSRAQTIEMTKAIGFEFKQAGYKAGKYTVGYQSCDDSTAQAGAWAPAKCSANAGNYVRDSSVIGVIGTFNSGCAEIEVPIGNRAGLQWVSPANTYVGLTHTPALAGEPEKYYPTGKRTYARVVAADDFQGAADALQLKALHVKSVYILNDKQAYGFGVASAMANVVKHGHLGLKLAGFQAWDMKASSYQDIATKIKASGADAVFLGGLECENGGKLIKDLRAGLGANFVIEAPDGFSSFTSTIKDAGSASNGMWITIAGEPYQDLNAQGKAFDAAFGKSIGRAAALVNPYSNYGATAALVMLKAIAGSGGKRTGVSKGVYNHSFTNTPIGNFKLNKNGDTNAGVISVYHIVGNNAPFAKIITPPASLVALAKP